MARLKKEITINDKRITIMELTVKEIRTFWNNMGEASKDGIDAVSDELKVFLPTCVTGLDPVEMDTMTPSELKQVYDGFQEVNKVFFEVAQIVEGNNPLLVNLRMAILNDLIVKFAGLLKRDMPQSSSMDTPSS